MMTRRAALFACCVMLIAPDFASGDDLAKQAAALKLITDTANELCTGIPLQGSTSEAEVSGKVSARVSGLLKKLTDLGVEGGGKYQKSEFRGVLQADLVAAVKNSDECKVTVLRELKDSFLKPTTPARKPTVDFKQKYIDSSAQPLQGESNFSIVVRAPLGAPINTLQAAVQRAVRSRGIHVIPLFRSQFSKDELDLQLFRGDASLARRLDLQKYCDTVLLGVARFSGPPQNQNASGLYLREAVLDLHAVSAGTGEVLRDLQVRAMGRGPDPDSSSADALQKLEQSAEEQVAEWSQL